MAMLGDEDDTPFLHRPDEHEAGAANELYCWLPDSGDRECSGSCVAYDIRFKQDQKFTPCMALNTIRSIGLSLGLQANTAVAAAAVARAPKPPKVGP
jgi:hypothetical protein